MRLSEIEMIANNLKFTNRPLWETARLISLFTVAPHMKKAPKLKELFPLPWDEEGQKAELEDMARYAKDMQAISKMLSAKMNQNSNNENNIQK